MKLVKISMELGIDEDEDFYLPGERSGGVFTPRFDHDKIAAYLNSVTDTMFSGPNSPKNSGSIYSLLFR